MRAPSDSDASRAPGGPLAIPAVNGRPPDGRRPVQSFLDDTLPGACAQTGPARESFLVILLRALSAWPA